MICSQHGLHGSSSKQDYIPQKENEMKTPEVMLSFPQVEGKRSRERSEKNYASLIEEEAQQQTGGSDCASLPLHLSLPQSTDTTMQP